MAISYLTRIESFNAAHKLWVEEWSEEKNIRMFGKCSNKNWHGHNYKLEVTIKGAPDPVTGFIIDAKKLSSIIKERVVDDLDHSNLNMDIKWIPKGTQPTSEVLCVLIWQQLKPFINEGELYRVKLQETETIYAEYFGE